MMRYIRIEVEIYDKMRRDIIRERREKEMKKRETRNNDILIKSEIRVSTCVSYVSASERVQTCHNNLHKFISY